VTDVTILLSQSLNYHKFCFNLILKLIYLSRFVFASPFTLFFKQQPIYLISIAIASLQQFHFSSINYDFWLLPFFCNVDSPWTTFSIVSLLLFRLPWTYLNTASVFYSPSAIWILQFLLQLAPLSVLLLPTPMLALLLPPSMQSCFPLLQQQLLFPSRIYSRSSTSNSPISIIYFGVCRWSYI